jgi:predicted HTH transcriptional regulator
MPKFGGHEQKYAGGTFFVYRLFYWHPIVWLTSCWLPNKGASMLTEEVREQRRSLILDCISKQPYATIDHISELTGLGRHQAYKIINEMQSSKIVNYNRSKRPGYWEILCEA